MREALLVCLIALAVPVHAAGLPPETVEAAGPLATEPGGGLDVAARVVSRSDRGATERVVVDVKLRSHRIASPLRVSAELSNGRRTEKLPDRIVHVPARTPRKVRYTVDLEQGLEHHLVFSVASEVDAEVHSSASVRVNLDPGAEPERPGDLVQYRAQQQGGTK